MSRAVDTLPLAPRDETLEYEGRETPVKVGRGIKLPAVQRFWPKVDKSGECWLWTAGINKQTGYALFRADGYQSTGHRFSWELANGSIPAGYDVHHTCGQRRCVRPDHLALVPHGRHHLVDPKHHSQRTQCPHGHAYTPENTYVTSAGHRQCRACKSHGAAPKGSEEHRARLRAKLRGRQHTPETRAKMSAAHRGVPLSPEHRARIAEGGRQLAATPEGREQRRAAARARHESR